MLTEKRYNIILGLLNAQGSVTVAELTERLGISESTARRDITALDKQGRLGKVFGGAVALDTEVSTHEPTVSQKADMNTAEKEAIGTYAAGLIEESDFVFVDSGTTTMAMAHAVTPPADTVFVTNGVSHAQVLAAAGCRVILIGGELKGTTEAVIGSAAISMIQQFHFSKGFFGTNGISKSSGYTTPEYNEAGFKSAAFRQCRKCFVLADSSKFDVTTSVTFADLSQATLVTDKVPEAYRRLSNTISVSEELS